MKVWNSGIGEIETDKVNSALYALIGLNEAEYKTVKKIIDEYFERIKKDLTTGLVISEDEVFKNYSNNYCTNNLIYPQQSE